MGSQIHDLSSLKSKSRKTQPFSDAQNKNPGLLKGNLKI